MAVIYIFVANIYMAVMEFLINFSVILKLTSLTSLTSTSDVIYSYNYEICSSNIVVLEFIKKTGHSGSLTPPPLTMVRYDMI